MKVGLSFDLRSAYLAEGYSEEQVAEFDSDSTILALEGALRSLGHESVRIGHARELTRRLAAGERWDLVFNIAEGLSGRNREAIVPCLLELYGVPYTFSDALVCATTLDKVVAKRLVKGDGIRTPRYAVVASEADLAAVRLRYPLFAKPACEGTGKGVDSRSRIENRAQLREVCARLLARFKQPVLVEEYLPGREFTTGILGTGARARVLGTMTLDIRSDAPASDYSYEVKEKCEEFVHYYAFEAGPLRDEIEAMALAAHRSLECRDTSRVDIRLDADGRPSFMELNPLPGLHPLHSDLPMIATQQGMAYEQLIGAIVESAMERVRSAGASVN
jgi:D-alanine-D-alanine ligase